MLTYHLAQTPPLRVDSDSRSSTHRDLHRRKSLARRRRSTLSSKALSLPVNETTVRRASRLCGRVRCSCRTWPTPAHAKIRRFLDTARYVLWRKVRDWQDLCEILSKVPVREPGFSVPFVAGADNRHLNGRPRRVERWFFVYRIAIAGGRRLPLNTRRPPGRELTHHRPRTEPSWIPRPRTSAARHTSSHS
jgi:hypothetical protein